jgi:transposase
MQGKQGVMHVISDSTGQTGLAIVNAILEGERNPLALAKLRNQRIQASEEVIAKSRVGDYRPEHLFTLQQSLTADRSYQTLIGDCDREIRRALQQFHPPDPPQASAPDIAPASPRSKTRSRDGVLRAELNRALGVDLTQIPGIRTGIAPTLLERLARTSPSSGALPHLPPGWACARITRSVAGGFCGWERAR